MDRPFQIFPKIRGDIFKSRCTTSINDSVGKFATSFASAVDTGGKFATGVDDTGGKFAAGVNDTGVIDTGGKKWDQYQAAEKIRNGPNGILRGLGETDSRKKTRSPNSRDTVPFTFTNVTLIWIKCCQKCSREATLLLSGQIFLLKRPVCREGFIFLPCNN